MEVFRQVEQIAVRLGALYRLSTSAMPSVKRAPLANQLRLILSTATDWLMLKPVRGTAPPPDSARRKRCALGWRSRRCEPRLSGAAPARWRTRRWITDAVSGWRRAGLPPCVRRGDRGRANAMTGCAARWLARSICPGDVLKRRQLHPWRDRPSTARTIASRPRGVRRAILCTSIRFSGESVRVGDIS
jgi:hypothetical protein